MSECTHDWYIADAGTAECCNCKVRYASAQLLLNQTQAELKTAQAFIHLKTQECEGVRASLLTATQAVFITARERQELKDENAKLREAAQAVVDDAYHFEDEHSDDELVALVDSEIIGNLAAALKGVRDE
jgi:hypothetical protein